MFCISYEQVWVCRVYSFYGGFSLGEELTETKFDYMLFILQHVVFYHGNCEAVLGSDSQ